MKDNIHEGHRSRLKNRFLNEGLANFEQHNVLELLLFFSIPVKDVNPIAHSLIQEFGSLEKVLDADFDRLCSVKGVSEHTATLITLMPQLFSRYSKLKLTENKLYGNSEDFLRMLVCDAATEKNEAVWIYLFDNLDRVIFSSKVFSGSVNSVKFDTRTVVELVLKKNASSMVVMHNHPDGSVFPSNMDKDTTMELIRVFTAIGVNFKEHYIAAGKNLFPILSDSGIITVKL